MTYTAEINTDGELIGYDPDLSSPHKKKSIHIPKRKIHRTTFSENNKMALSPLKTQAKSETKFSELVEKACHIESVAETASHHRMAINAWKEAKKLAETDKQKKFCDQRIHLNENKITIWGSHE